MYDKAPDKLFRIDKDVSKKKRCTLSADRQFIYLLEDLIDYDRILYISISFR